MPENIGKEKILKEISPSSNGGVEVVTHGHDIREQNGLLINLMKEMKLMVLELIDQIQCVRMWITLNIPKIEDGNNFGVSVQEDILAELKNVENEFDTLLSVPCSYHGARAKVISKCLKYPDIPDYRLAVEECDEQSFLQHRSIYIEIRNGLATLIDVIVKNKKKLLKPKGDYNHSQSFY